MQQAELDDEVGSYWPRKIAIEGRNGVEKVPQIAQPFFPPFRLTALLSPDVYLDLRYNGAS